MIYLVADIHGYIRLEWLKAQLDKIPLTEADYLIILGDAGIIWSKDEHGEVMEYYQGLACKTLFLDGNHENFDLLYQYPVERFCGGQVHRISDRLYHLMRGEVYLFDGQTFFVFGGGFSVKKLTHSSPISVWEQEMPTESEYQNGISNLERANYQVDYVLTHVAPSSLAYIMGVNLVQEERVLNDYLEHLAKRVTFKKWYFGHHHRNMQSGAFTGLYSQVRRLGE